MGKAKSLPYFKLYPSDAETDENFRAMSDSELGFYWRCLNHSWLNGGLPADPGELARVLRVSRKCLAKHWARVGKCFVRSTESPDRLVNPRQEKERIEAIAKSESASKSVRTRYERSTKEPLRAYESDYESESESKKETPNGIFELDSKFAELWQAYPEHKRVKRGDAERAFVAVFGPWPAEWQHREFAAAIASLSPGGAWRQSEAFTRDGGKYFPGIVDFIANWRWQEVPMRSQVTAAEQRDAETLRLLQEQIGGGNA